MQGLARATTVAITRKRKAKKALKLSYAAFRIQMQAEADAVRTLAQIEAEANDTSEVTQINTTGNRKQ